MLTEFCLAERNSAHVLVSARISRLLETCLSVIHNANYIVNSIVCAVILVRGSRVPAYGIRPMHGPIHVVNMHGTGTKHIVRHSQKSVIQWSVISKFTCTLLHRTRDSIDWCGSTTNYNTTLAHLVFLCPFSFYCFYQCAYLSLYTNICSLQFFHA